MAEVTVNVAIPLTDHKQAHAAAQDAARAAVRAALGSDALAIARVIRDDLAPTAHALRVYLWIGGDDPELLSEIIPPPELD